MASILIPLALALIAFAISLRSFLGKGAPWNNAYLFASPQERKTMDKAPYYRQSAIAFCLLGLIFSALTLEAWWLNCVALALCLAAVIYALASSAAIERKQAAAREPASHERGD